MGALAASLLDTLNMPVRRPSFACPLFLVPNTELANSPSLGYYSNSCTTKARLRLAPPQVPYTLTAFWGSLAACHLCALAAAWPSPASLPALALFALQVQELAHACPCPRKLWKYMS